MPSRNNSPIQSQNRPTDDSSRATCRYFIRGKCHRGERCRFYHPRSSDITPAIKKRAFKELGKCYCGACQITLVNKTPWRGSSDDRDSPLFFVVCGRTRKSTKRCM